MRVTVCTREEAPVKRRARGRQCAWRERREGVDGMGGVERKVFKRPAATRGGGGEKLMEGGELLPKKQRVEEVLWRKRTVCGSSRVSLTQRKKNRT